MARISPLTQITRREVLGGAAALATISIVPSSVLGGPGKTAPSDKPTVGGVGIGGVGHGQIQQVAGAGFQVVALCDVDDVMASRTWKKFPQARKYRDFREMLAKEGDKVDAVYCGTPDHTHAIVSMAALKAKKHCLTVKPLTRTIGEGRMLAEAAAKAGVMTQMTASPASTESGCRTCELIWDGIVGDVTEVHIWSNRPLWPHGMARPKGSDPIPKTFDWDMWLGPAAKRPFVKRWPAGSLELAQVKNFNPRPDVYHAWNFRGWIDFGTGALGDMGCHHWNTPRRALKLGHPTSVSASSTKMMGESWPLGSIITYHFPAREKMPPVKVVWYDGGLRPARPAEMEPGRTMPRDGIIYRGTKGVMMAGGSSGIPQLMPESKRRAYKAPPKTLKRRSGIYGEWYEAVRGGEKPSEHWPDCAVPLTEIVLLGCAALQAQRPLQWDGPNMKFTNYAAGDKLIKPDYQNGWKL